MTGASYKSFYNKKINNSICTTFQINKLFFNYHLYPIKIYSIGYIQVAQWNLART